MSNPALAVFSPTKKMSRRIRALAKCPQIIPGIEPSGTNTEQISDAIASAEKRSGVCCARLAVAGADDTCRGAGREAGCGGGGDGSAPPGAASTGAGFIGGTGAAAGGVFGFLGAGQAIPGPPSLPVHPHF